MASSIGCATQAVALADSLDESSVGWSIQRAQRTLVELEQFARD